MAGDDGGAEKWGEEKAGEASDGIYGRRTPETAETLQSSDGAGGSGQGLPGRTGKSSMSV